jgi:beta-lactamase regulating signal transducer with metallopeptidase domain
MTSIGMIMITTGMISTADMQDSTNLLAQVAEPALRALGLALVAGAGLRVLRVRATAVRLFTWTTVLYGALAMPLLGWVLPPLAVPAPAFLAGLIGQQGVGAGSQPLSRRIARSSAMQVERPGERRTSAPGAVTVSSTGMTSPASEAKADSEESGFIATRGALRPKSSLNRLFTSWNLYEWIATATWVYLAVALLLLVRMGVGIEFSRRLVGEARQINDPRAIQRLASRAYASGLHSIPDAAESELVSVPVTLGALRSTILLPLEWREWSDAKLDAVIAHEVAHVARRDGLTQRLSLLHRALFWFSPLAWWLDRKLAELAEQASDEAALSGGADRNEYARTLLGFFEALQATPGRVWWQGVAMAKPGVSERQTERLVEERLERILSWKGSIAMGAKSVGTKSMLAKKSIAVAVLVLAIPVVYLAASAHPSVASVPQAAQPAQEQTPAPNPASDAKPSAAIVPDAHVAPAIVPDAPPADPDMGSAPEAAPQAEAPTAPSITGAVSGGILTPPAPVAMAPLSTLNVNMGPVSVAVPVPPQIYSSASSDSPRSSYSADPSGGSSYRYSYDTDNDEHWVMVSGKSDSLTMSGNMDDAHHVEKLKKQIPGDFIWFERGDKSYVIRDQATIDRARKLWDPQGELGKKQEALGAQQEALGKQQEELGSKMEQVQVKVPDMTAALDKLKAELKALSSSATMEDMGRVQSEIGDLQSRIAELQSQAGEQQSKLGEQQSVLGEKQSRLGQQQGELGRQQAALAREANRQMKILLDEAIKKGIAQLEL